MKQLTKAASLLTGVSVMEMLFRFVRTKCIAIFLDRAGTGLLAQLTLFFEMLRVWGDMGSRRAMIRHIAGASREGLKSEALKSNVEYRDVLSTSFFLVLTASGLISLATTLGSHILSFKLFGSAAYWPFVAAVGIMLPLASLSSLIGAVLKGGQMYGSFARVTAAAYLATVAAVPILIYFFQYWGAIAAQLLMFAGPLIGYVWLNLRKPFLFFSRRIHIGILKDELSYSLIGLYSNTFNHLSKLVIATWITRALGLEQMGIYQVVITFSTVYLSVPIQAVTGYTLPTVAKANTQEEIGEAVNNTLRYLFFLLTPVIFGILLVPEIVIRLFFSGQFLDAVPVLRIQIFGALISLVSASFAPPLVAKAKKKAMLVVATVGPLSTLALASALFGRYGLNGIAAAMVGGLTITMMTHTFFMKKYFAIKLQPKNRKLLAASVGWLLSAVAAGLWGGHSGWSAGALALGAPWFWFSSKDHERRFLWATAASLGRRGRAKAS